MPQSAVRWDATARELSLPAHFGEVRAWAERAIVEAARLLTA